MRFRSYCDVAAQSKLCVWPLPSLFSVSRLFVLTWGQVVLSGTGGLFLFAGGSSQSSGLECLALFSWPASCQTEVSTTRWPVSLTLLLQGYGAFWYCHVARSATDMLGCGHSHLGTSSCGLSAAGWRPLTLALSEYLEGPYALLKPLPVSKEIQGGLGF